MTRQGNVFLIIFILFFGYSVIVGFISYIYILLKNFVDSGFLKGLFGYGFSHVCVLIRFFSLLSIVYLLKT